VFTVYSSMRTDNMNARHGDLKPKIDSLIADA